MIILRLDKNSGLNKNDVKAFEHDNLSETYIIQLLKYGEVYDLTNKTVELTILEKKRKVGNMFNLPIYNAKEGKVELNITSSLTRLDGIYDFKLTVKGIDGLIETFPSFQVEIKNDITDHITGEIVQDKNFTILTEGLKALADYNIYKTNALKVPEIEQDIIEINSQLDTKIQKGQVQVSDINKDYGKFDQTYMTDEFLQQMAGTTPINVVPADNSITPNKTTFFVTGKNLFNKNTITTGYYVDYLTGTLKVNASYSASDYIKIEANTNYIPTVGHSEQMAWYDANKSFISGIINPGAGCLSPANAVYARLSVVTTKKDTFQFEKGTVRTAYEPYKLQIPRTIIEPTESKNIENSLVTIDIKENGDYPSVNSALASIADNPSNVVTNLIMPGVYKETVDVTDRYISLIGIDKENTIIQTDTGHYDYPPLKCGGGKVYIENITFKATHDNPASDFSSTTNRAYAVHADYGGSGQVEFKNCKLIAHQCASLGSGLQPNQRYIFRDCDFELHYDSAFATGSQTYGSIFCHSYGATSTTPMNYEFYNCRFYVKGGYTNRNLYITKQYADMLCLFVNCYVHGDTKTAFIHDYSGLGTPYVLINTDSFGNNIASINGA